MKGEAPRSRQSEAPTDGLGTRLVLGIATQGVSVLALLLTTPILLKKLGAESYGLIAFSITLQAWMLILDMGTAAVLARQLSRFRANALSGDHARSLMFVCEIFWLLVGGTALAGFLFLRQEIAASWLGLSALSNQMVASCLALMAVLLTCRWLSGMYQSALSGLERQISANLVALCASLARAGASVGALFYISSSPILYFAINAFIAFLEVIISRAIAARNLSNYVRNLQKGLAVLTGDLRFAAGLVGSSLIGTAIYQADRLTLSHSLSLGEYGQFGLVVTICSGILMVVPPFVQAFQPRLTILFAQNRRPEAVEIYRVCIAVSFALAIGIAGPIAAKPDWVIYAWTGDMSLARQMESTLGLYAFGAGIAAYLFAPAMLQYARGMMRLHVVGYAIFALVWIPASIWAAMEIGTIGTAIVWLIGNLVYLATWVPFVHSRLLETAERVSLDLAVWLRWIVAAVSVLAIHFLCQAQFSRIDTLALLAGMSVLASISAGLSFRPTRGLLKSELMKFVDLRHSRKI